MLQKGKARLRRAALSGDRSYFLLDLRQTCGNQDRHKTSGDFKFWIGLVTSELCAHVGKLNFQ